MPSLPSEFLLAKLCAALPAGTICESPANQIHPALLNVPGFGKARIYLWTVTHIESKTQARPLDEYKIQLILPEQTRGNRGRLNLLESHHTFLLGYSPDFGVFVAWQPRLHEEFGYSSAVQVREPLLQSARLSGWAVGRPREVQRGSEVSVALSPGNLLNYLILAREADLERRFGHSREAFFLSRTPNTEGYPLPENDEEYGSFASRLRRMLKANRLSRDAKFSPLVKKQYGHSCAVCCAQLKIVEAAHIIPIREPSSEDEAWNGIALCPNHHKLFDNYTLIVKKDLTIHVDYSVVAYLRECKRAGGLDELVLPFHGKNMREPSFFGRDAGAKSKMLDALSKRQSLAGFQ